MGRRFLPETATAHCNRWSLGVLSLLAGATLLLPPAPVAAQGVGRGQGVTPSDCQTLNQNRQFGRVAWTDGKCVILDRILVGVADGYTLNQAATQLGNRSGWTVTHKISLGKILIGEYSPDNLTLTQLTAEITAITGLAWARYAEFDSFASHTGGAGIPPTSRDVPDPVSSVNVVHNGSTLSVSWPASARATKYDVEYQESTATSWTSAATDHTSTSLTVSSVDAAKTYMVRVKAKNAGGASGWTNSLAAAALTAQAGDREVLLSWPLDLNATSFHYQIQAGGGSWGQWTQMAGSGLKTHWLVGSLNNGTRYRFRVRATNARNQQTVSTTATATPVAPSNALAKPTVTTEAGHRQVTLSWAADSAATGWEVQRREPNGTWGRWTPTFRAAPGYTQTPLTNGQQYGFRVRGTGAGGIKGAASNLVLATPAAPTTTPAKPIGLTATGTGGGRVRLEWSGIGHENTVAKWEYRYKRSGGSYPDSWTTMTDGFGRFGIDISYTVTGLDATKEYAFQVRGVNASGTPGPASDDVATEAVPDPVTSVNVTHNGASLTVSWDAPARATHYDVTYTNTSTGRNARAAWNRAGTSLTITCDSRPEYQNQYCVDSGAIYTVGVRARNTGGTSAWVNSAPTARPGVAAPPDPVASVNAVHNGASLTVSWATPARATHYDVTYTNTSTGRNARAAWNQAGTSLTITCDSRSEHRNQYCVDSGAIYTVGVRARNAGGTSSWVNSAPAAPPALSVADATVAEPGAGQSASLDFVVSLNRAASAAVSVDYATSNGTATAGVDYTTATGTLTFAVGETEKTVSVTVLNDAHDEGSETMTLTLSNVTGAVIDSNAAVATGTITNDDPTPQAWISRFGRTVADQVLDAVETRLRSAPAPGVDVYLAGERLEWPDGSDGTQPVAQQVADQVAQWLVAGSGDNGDAAVRTVNGDDLLSSSSFALASPTSGGGLLSFWGRGSITNFDGREGELRLDGQVTTVMLGTDWSWGQWPDGGEGRRSIAGLLLSRSTADGGYTGSDAGEVDASLTGVFPWVGHRFSHQLEAWGAAGYGQGELEVTPKPKDTTKDGATLTADLNLWLAAGGLRGTLLDGGSEGLTVTGKGDAMVVGTSSGQVTGANDNLAASQATVTRLRLELEAHRTFPLGNPDSGTGAGSGATLTPSLEVGLRHDGGDAETGFGLDLGGGIVLSHPERGLQAELRGRGLLSHAAEGFRDRGFSGSLSWQQCPDSDLGAVLSLSQTMGGSSSGGADALLSRATLEGLAANNDGSNKGLNNQRLEFQLSYGLPAFGDRFTLTPELGLGFYDNGRDYRLGWSLTQPDGGESFAFSFDLTRRESANNEGAAPEHGVQLGLNTRF